MSTPKEPVVVATRYRWFILNREGNVCWPCGMTRGHAIRLWLDKTDDGELEKRWLYQEQQGYRCVRLKIEAP